MKASAFSPHVTATAGQQGRDAGPPSKRSKQEWRKLKGERRRNRVAQVEGGCRAPRHCAAHVRNLVRKGLLLQRSRLGKLKYAPPLGGTDALLLAEMPSRLHALRA